MAASSAGADHGVPSQVLLTTILFDSWLRSRTEKTLRSHCYEYHYRTD